MRIAYICADPGVPVFGCKGSSVHVQEVIRALRGHGAKVELFAAKFGGEPPADLADLKCNPLPHPPKTDASEREAACISANDALRSALELRASFDLVYERYSLWSFAGMAWAHDQALRSVLEVNSPLVEEQSKHRVLHDRSGAERIARSVFESAQSILAVSSGVAAYVGARVTRPEKVRVVSNGVDASRFQGRESRSVSSDETTIGFVGTLKPWHGLSTLIQAASLARAGGLRFRLLIVGDGPERGRIEAELESCGLRDCTDITGAVEPAMIPGLLAQMDIAAAPYPDLPEFYFSPLKIMEYMAAGRAIVASRIGDIDGLIVDRVSGLLCPPGDEQSLCEAITLLARNPKMRARMGAAARLCALEDLSWHRVAERILAMAEVQELSHVGAGSWG